MPPSRKPGPQSDAGTFLALLGLVLAAAGLLVLAMMVLPQAVGLLLVIGGFVFVGVFHYLVWGWWLSARSEDDGRAEDDGRRDGADPRD